MRSARRAVDRQHRALLDGTGRTQRHRRQPPRLDCQLRVRGERPRRACAALPLPTPTARTPLQVSPSTIFAVASILEGCPYINGSPQNTFVPGVVELAERHDVLIGGDDFKSGQTKMKSVMVDFLVSAGIKPTSIVSYNHLGNNDGKNLSAPQTFRSKEISKAGVVEDMVASNRLLYAEGEHPDHVVVIKYVPPIHPHLLFTPHVRCTLSLYGRYVPAVGDSKRALDECSPPFKPPARAARPSLALPSRRISAPRGRAVAPQVLIGDIHGRHEHHRDAQHVRRSRIVLSAP